MQSKDYKVAEDIKNGILDFTVIPNNALIVPFFSFSAAYFEYVFNATQIKFSKFRRDNPIFVMLSDEEVWDYMVVVTSTKSQ